MLASTRPSSPASTSTYFSDEAPRPTLTRAPGSTSSAWRSCASTACLLTPPRSSRWVMLIVRTALRTSVHALRRERIAAGGAAADRGVDQLDVAVALHDLARLLRPQSSVCSEGAARRQRDRDLGLRQVVRRDEAGGQQRHQREAAEEEGGGGQQRQQPVLEAPGGPAQVDRDPARLAVLALRRAQDVGRHHRREHARHHQRGEDRDRRRPAELHEELAGDARHEGGRQEHRDQREGGRDHRQADLVGRLHRGLQRRLAHAQVPHDVLDLDDGVVDEDADHQRQAEQVTVLIEKPNQCITAKAGITDSGSAVAATSVARQSRRNSHTTSTASNAPSYSRYIEPW